MCLPSIVLWAFQRVILTASMTSVPGLQPHFYFDFFLSNNIIWSNIFDNICVTAVSLNCCILLCSQVFIIIIRPHRSTTSRNHEVDGVQVPYGKGKFSGKCVPIVKFRDFLLWSVQKQLNHLICHLDCRVGWTQGSTSSLVFARWCLIGATWRIRLNRPSVAAMRPYLRLLWPFLLLLLLIFPQHSVITKSVLVVHGVNWYGFILVSYFQFITYVAWWLIHITEVYKKTAG